MWAGLVKGVYQRAEERIAKGKMVWNETDKSFDPVDNGKDFLRAWRVTRAKKILVERFGLTLIRRAIAYAVVFLIVLVTLIVLEATRTTHAIAELHARFTSSIESALTTTLATTIAGLLTTVKAIVPSFKLAFASNMESNVFQGEEIFKKASTVRDQLGFLAMVKQELQELFDYLREFERETGVKIVLAPIVDDLDRCIKDGRNVKVLEAMQLILSVPGAPVISFLAVDSRIVVASIEEHFEKVFAQSNISGHEYLGKIVQLPFAIPEPPSQKVERLLTKALEGNTVSPTQVAQRLVVFREHANRLLFPLSSTSNRTEDTKPHRLIFKVARSTLVSREIAVPLERLVHALKRDLEAGLLPGEGDSLALVCKFARELGSSKLPDQIGSMVELGNVDKEAVEILCRDTNAALEAGDIVLEEVYIAHAYIHCP